MIVQTYNIPLIMDDTNATHWYNLLVCARDAYNRCTRILHDNKITLSLKKVHEACYNVIRTEFPALSSQMVIKCEQAAASALKSIKANKHKNAEVPQRKSLTMTLDKRLYGVLTSEGITITGAQKNKRTFVPFNAYPKAKEMLSTYKACDPTIFYRNGNFFLSVPFEVPEKPLHSEECIGVDLGARMIFVTSEGKAFKDTTYLKKRREIRYLKRKLQEKGTKSETRHLKKVRNKERNLSKDMCYRASKALINSTNASIIVMEDLTKIKKKTSRTSEGYKRVKHNNALSQIPFYEFKRILTYKAPLAGKQVETVSPMYTSQMDCRTNNRDGERRGRRYICVDGVVFDSDWNAAINIGQRSNHPVSSSLPIEGQLVIFTGREQSTSQSTHFFNKVVSSTLL